MVKESAHLRKIEIGGVERVAFYVGSLQIAVVVAVARVSVHVVVKINVV